MDGDAAAPGLTRYAVLCIDAPNVQFRYTRGVREYIEHTRINWVALVSAMLESLEVDRYRLRGALYFYRSDENAIRRQAQEVRFALSLYRDSITVTGLTQDVDAMLVARMGADIVRVVREWGTEQSTEPCEITVLLASGDKVYSQALWEMREALHGLARIHLHTFSWEDKLSEVLRRASQRVIYLNNIPGIIRS